MFTTKNILKYQIRKPLAILFNKSINSGRIFVIWKLANIIPIEKKGDKSLPVNYRPIGLTSVFDKLIQCDKLVTLLEENIMINILNMGSVINALRLTNLLDFYNDVFNNHDETKAVL